MPSCVFLTLSDPIGYRIDDHLAADELEARGWQVNTLPWTIRDVDWSAYDAVIVRSTWDYHKNVEAFFEVMEQIEQSDAQLFNSVDLMQWNADKRYLADLAERGVPTVPTVFGRRLEAGDAAHFRVLLECDQLVIKPIHGANAEGAFRIASDLAPEAAVQRFRSDHFMAQVFASSVQSEGEFSLFFFGGAFSHAIQKVPKAGDFRVQEEHGGAITPWEPEPSALEAATQSLTAIEQSTLYARVDLVRSNDLGEWWLMELEVIEPSMYFRMDDHAAVRFADALEHVLG